MFGQCHRLRSAQQHFTPSSDSVCVTVGVSPPHLSTHIYLQPPAGRLYTVDFIHGRRLGQPSYCIHTEEGGVEMLAEKPQSDYCLKQPQLLRELLFSCIF